MDLRVAEITADVHLMYLLLSWLFLGEEYLGPLPLPKPAEAGLEIL